MTFSLNDDEQNGVSIAVNTILKIAYRVEEDEDWSAAADQWWKTPREDGQSAVEMLADDPGSVVSLALGTLISERYQEASRTFGIYVLPTEDDLPPRAVFLVEVANGVQAPVGGAAYIDDAWRYPDGTEVQDDLAQAITDHAESLGVEWDH